MKALVRLVCLCVAASLSACGGGGGGAPDVPATPDQCTLGLAYVNGQNSGIAIAETQDWTAQINEVARTFTPSCPLLKIERIQVQMCVAHTQLKELRAQLLAPNNSRIDLPLSAPESNCMGVSNHQLITVTVNGDLLAQPTGLNGNWRVQLRDLKPGFGSGSFIAWSLRLEGVK